MSHLNGQAERSAITAAMDRLLGGTPVRSTGALTVVQLAAEAGVKRWILTHKHTDLRDEFQRRAQAASKLPAAFQHLEAKITDLQADNRALRSDNRRLKERNDIYAMVINELSIMLRRAELLPTQPANVTRLKPPVDLISGSAPHDLVRLLVSPGRGAPMDEDGSTADLATRWQPLARPARTAARRIASGLALPS